MLLEEPVKLAISNWCRGLAVIGDKERKKVDRRGLALSQQTRPACQALPTQSCRARRHPGSMPGAFVVTTLLYCTFPLQIIPFTAANPIPALYSSPVLQRSPGSPTRLFSVPASNLHHHRPCCCSLHLPPLSLAQIVAASKLRVCPPGSRPLARWLGLGFGGAIAVWRSERRSWSVWFCPVLGLELGCEVALLALNGGCRALGKARGRVDWWRDVRLWCRSCTDWVCDGGLDRLQCAQGPWNSICTERRGDVGRRFPAVVLTLCWKSSQSGIVLGAYLWLRRNRLGSRAKVGGKGFRFWVST
jgi:hypothetical protein